MNRKTHVFNFDNGRGDLLSGRMELPKDQAPLTFGIFANCFTCAKEFFAPTKVSRALAEQGIAMLRFDFTGLGKSEGFFPDTNFSTKIEDLKAASKAIYNEFGKTPELLVGHSLGGAAALAATAHLPDIKTAATIGSPRGPGHVLRHFEEHQQIMEQEGKIEITVADRKYILKKQFLEDLDLHNLKENTQNFKGAIFVFHAPDDDMVAFENAQTIFDRATEPRFLHQMDGAGHMIEKQQDTDFIAQTLANWIEKNQCSNKKTTA